MTQPTPSQIDALKPQERRYDLPIEDDFVISVLPNGIKTWVYLYASDGRVQRRTLGVYPDMSPEAARVSLEAARATRRSLLEASERAEALRHEERAVTPARARARRRSRSPIAAAAAVFVVAAGALIAWRVANDGGDALVELPAAVKAPAADGSERPVIPEREAPPDAGASDADVLASAADEVGVAEEMTVDASTEDTGAEDGSAIVPLSHVAAGAPVPPEPQGDAAAESETTAGAAPDASVGDAPDASLVAADAAGEDAPDASAEAAASDATANAAPASGDMGTKTHDPHVTRALLAGGVVALEPVEPLGNEVVGVPGGVEKVYFYTELRGLGGERVLYRWLHEGRVEAEIPVTVGASWRWRTYSQKDLLPNKTGRWQAQLLDEDGRVLAETSFVYRNDAPQSADAS